MADPSLAGDAEPVRRFWRELGLPGLFDVHVHFLPPNIQRAVWAQFDQAGPKIGLEWPIRYRAGEQQRISWLREFGVRRFGALPYAHKPGVATYLNDWAADFARRTPDALWSATCYPEPEAAGYVAELLDGGIEVFKVHVQVGEFHLDDPLLDPVWGQIADAGTPVVIHAGSGPVGNAYTGPEPLARVLARHPGLKVIVAHLGAPEFEAFLGLAERYDRTHLDTTMMFTDFFPATFPDHLLPRLAGLGERTLLGSDFPAIPYPYAHQLEGLARLRYREPRLDDAWLRGICWTNAVGLFGDPEARSR